MAVIFPGKLIFLEQPRTGSTAVRLALKAAGGIPRSRHMNLVPRKGEVVISTVRNPYDMWVTWFLNKAKTLDITDFEEFFHAFTPKDGLLYWHAKNAYHVLRYENLNKDLNRILKMVGLKPVKLKRQNVTRGKKPYMTYWTDYKLLNKFNDKYAPEFTQHGYKAR